MTGNLGATTLRRRRRNVDPMQAYDMLPQPLRNWLADAALPWSPRSCKRIWDKARKEGLSPDDALVRLISAEQKTLARDRLTARTVYAPATCSTLKSPSDIQPSAAPPALHDTRSGFVTAPRPPQ